LVGALYFAAVFAVGFVLGTVRVLVIAPRLGELASTLIELPIILTAAWLICGAIIKRLAVPRAPGARIAMGVVAFALLMAAEAGLSVALFGNTLEGHIAGYRALPAATGLVGQVVFALFPWLQLRAADPGAGGTATAPRPMR
jgi:hypothetical protein